MALEDKTSRFSSISTTKVGTNNLTSNVSPNRTGVGTNNLTSNVSPIKMNSGTNNLQSNFAGGGQYVPGGAGGGTLMGGGQGGTQLSQADVTPGEGLAK